jgi:transposase
MTELITARDWLTVFQLPPYAHELNPAGLVWSISNGRRRTWPSGTCPSSPRW